VLELVASGTTNREAVARLFITEATVKTHLLNIYAKLGVNDRTSLRKFSRSGASCAAAGSGRVSTASWQ
jgi:DNA-binding NarL/FixJ family response regulator